MPWSISPRRVVPSHRAPWPPRRPSGASPKPVIRARAGCETGPQALGLGEEPPRSRPASRGSCATRSTTGVPSGASALNAPRNGRAPAFGDPMSAITAPGAVEFRVIAGTLLGVEEGSPGDRAWGRAWAGARGRARGAASARRAGRGRRRRDRGRHTRGTARGRGAGHPAQARGSAARVREPGTRRLAGARLPAGTPVRGGRAGGASIRAARRAFPSAKAARKAPAAASATNASRTVIRHLRAGPGILGAGRRHRSDRRGGGRGGT